MNDQDQRHLNVIKAINKIKAASVSLSSAFADLSSSLSNLDKSQLSIAAQESLIPNSTFHNEFVCLLLLLLLELVEPD
jgi:hypothetical protein